MVVTFRSPNWLIEEITRIANEMRISRSEVIRLALVYYLAKYRPKLGLKVVYKRKYIPEIIRYN